MYFSNNYYSSNRGSPEQNMQRTRLIQSNWEKKDNSRIHWKSLKAKYNLNALLFQVFYFISGSWSRLQNSSKDENQASSLYGLIFRFNWEIQNWTPHNIPSFAHWSVQHARIYLWNHRKETCCLKCMFWTAHRLQFK